MQAEELACLPVGSEVSAKYKGAFCEAKVKKVHRVVKCRITFKLGLGSFTLCDSLLKGNILAGATVQAKHPEKGTFLDAVINKIQDQSHYTVVFDDGDIATLRRNALCMKSGKHFNASESLDNLPLTHPEHFGTPVGGRRRGRVEEEEEEEESSEDEESNQPYLGSIGRVVCVEVTDKKQTKAKENWFPGLVVAPNAQEIVKINTKEDFLVRSFKDHRYYTVPKKECKRFHRETAKSSTDTGLLKAVENAVAYLDEDVLPPHWDREILFDMREETSTGEASSEEDVLESGEEDSESTEEKDHLVAELYKHMDDRGTPINRTPSIGTSDVDLYRLFKVVQRLGGQNRVTAHNQWRQVAKKLGFETNWCVNQVRVCYNRYLHSFEDLYRTLGCTLVNHPRGNLRIRHGSGRPLARGVRIGSRSKEEEEAGGEEDNSDRSSVSSQYSETRIKQEPEEDKEAAPVPKKDGRGRKKGTKLKKEVKEVKEEKDEKEEELNETLELETEIVERKNKKGPGGAKGKGSNLFSRPRRDSSSSLSTASEAKGRREGSLLVKQDVEKEDEDSDSSGKVGRGRKKRPKEEEDEDFGSDLDSTGTRKKKFMKKKLEPSSGESPGARSNSDISSDHQHLKENVVCNIGDKIKVFWLHGQIYDAKIMKTEPAQPNSTWPRYYVHYQGWNSRYDEWIPRGRIADNLSWTNSNKPRGGPGRPASSPSAWKKRKDEDKSDLDIKTEDDMDDEEEMEKEGLKRKEEEKKMKIKKRRSATPSSTPSSSRTNSPAGSRQTRSPTKQISPVKEDRNKDEPEIKPEPKRTESPVTRKNVSSIKRQNSTSSGSRSEGSLSSLAEEAKLPEPEAEPEKKPRKLGGKKKLDLKGKLVKKTKLCDAKKLGIKKLKKEEPTEPQIKFKAGKEKEEDLQDEVEEEDDEEDLGDEEERILTVRKSSRTGKAEDQITSKNKPGSLTPEPTKKAEPSDTDTVSKDDLKRISDCKSSPVGPDTPRTSARLESRRPVTPSSEQKTSSMRAPTPSKALFRSSDLEDPYDFKEVEEGFSRFEPSKVLEEPVIKVEAEEEKKEEKKPGRGRKKKIIPVEVKTEKVDELETKPEVRVQPISCVEPEPAKPIAEIDQAKPFPESEPVLKVGLDPPTSGIPLNTEKPATSARDNSTSDLDPDLLIPKKEAETKFKVEIKEEDKVEKKEESDRPKTNFPSLNNRFALFPHLASLSAAKRSVLASLPAVAPALPPVLPPTPPVIPFTSLSGAGFSTPSTGSLGPLTSASMISTIVGYVIEENMLKERKAQEEKEETKIEQVKNTKEERNIKNEDGESKKEKEREKVDPTKTDLDEEQHEVKIEKNESESESKKCSDSDGLLKPNLSPKHRRSQESPRKSRRKPKIRGPRNYNLKSREVVTDSDSDSSEDSSHSRLGSASKRRRTHDEDLEFRAELKVEEKAEVDTEAEAEKSLVCEEIFDRSPERVFDMDGKRVEKKNPEDGSKGKPEGSMNKNEEASMIKNEGGNIMKNEGGIDRKAEGMMRGERRKEITKNVLPVHSQKLEDTPKGDQSPESSEVDLESLTGSPKRTGSDLESLTGRTRGGAGSDIESLGRGRRAGSADSRLEYSSSSETRSGRGERRKIPAEKSPISLKRKRKSRDSMGRGRGKGRGRIPSLRPSRAEEPEEIEQPMIGTRSRTDLELLKLDRLDNAALAALAQPKPNTNSKYNFYVKLEPEMNSEVRINVLQRSLEDLRKTYLHIKTELTALERRRKKMRKKEKERHQRNNQSDLPNL